MSRILSSRSLPPSSRDARQRRQRRRLHRKHGVEAPPAAAPKPQYGTFGFDTLGMERSVAVGETMNENVADLAGLTVAHDAYIASLNGAPPPAIDGLSADQRFYLDWAQVWRCDTREAAARSGYLPTYIRPVLCAPTSFATWTPTRFRSKAGTEALPRASGSHPHLVARSASGSMGPPSSCCTRTYRKSIRRPSMAGDAGLHRRSSSRGQGLLRCCFFWSASRGSRSQRYSLELWGQR